MVSVLLKGINHRASSHQSSSSASGDGANGALAYAVRSSVPGASPELISTITNDVVAQLMPVLAARVDAAVAASALGARNGRGGDAAGAAFALAPPSCPSCPKKKDCPSASCEGAVATAVAAAKLSMPVQERDCPPQRQCPPQRECDSDSAGDGGSGSAYAIAGASPGEYSDSSGETNITALRERIVYLETKLAKKDQKLQNKEEDIKNLRIENDAEVHKCMKREVYERKLRQRLEGRIMGVMALSLETKTKVIAKECADSGREPNMERVSRRRLESSEASKTLLRGLLQAAEELRVNGTHVSEAAVEAVEALITPDPAESIVSAATGEAIPGEAFVEERVMHAVKTLEKETKVAERNNATLPPERVTELETAAAQEPGWENRRDGEGDDPLTAAGRTKFYAALESEAKNIISGISVTGHRPGHMLQGSPYTNPALRASNPILYSLQQAGGDGRAPLKRCALVGNSQQQLTDSTRGTLIDGFDFVMRLNQAPTEGFEAYVGNKTSMRLINAAWVLSYSRDVERKGAKGKLTLEEGVTVLGSRTDPWHFTRLAQALAKLRPDVTPLLLSRQGLNEIGDVLRALKAKLEAMRGLEYPGKGSPSSGFVGMFILIQLCQSVDVFGVGAGATSTSSWHYWEQRNFGESREFGLEPHHSFELEHDLAIVFAAAGLVNHHKVDLERFHAGDGNSGSEGASAKDVAPEILRLAKERKKERLKAEKEAERAQKEAEAAAVAAARGDAEGNTNQGSTGTHLHQLPGDPLRMAHP